MPVSMTSGSSTYYLAYDQVGSLRTVTDSSGNIVKRIDYDSFGNVLSDSNPVFTVPFGFAGGLHDRDTGLVRFGLRDYDPTIGKWTAKDPIDFHGGDVNLFNYVVADPINKKDPHGTISGLALTVIGVAITVGIASYYLYKSMQDASKALDKTQKATDIINQTDNPVDNPEQVDEASRLLNEALHHTHKAAQHGTQCPGTSTGGPLSDPSR